MAEDDVLIEGNRREEEEGGGCGCGGDGRCGGMNDDTDDGMSNV